jgi:hypothetical protein
VKDENGKRTPKNKEMRSLSAAKVQRLAKENDRGS